MRLETLETRRLLAVFVVTSADDVVDQNDGVISLREAITAANGTVGPDQVTFDPSVFNRSIEIDLVMGQLDINDSLTITGPQQQALRIDGQGDSRVIGFFASEADLTLESLTIAGGRTIQDDVNTSQSGGAIRFASAGTLTLNDVTVTDSSTAGAGARGGGIFAEPGDVVLNRSAIVRNNTSGTGGHGGGIYAGAGTITLIDSRLSGNTTTQTNAKGGGIYSVGSLVSLTSSSLSDNRTLGDLADGGGIYSLAGVALDRSVVTGNATTGRDSDGGAIFTLGSLAITRSDLSFNRTEGRYAGGGAVAADDADVTIDNSSIAHNRTDGAFSYGGGLFAVRSDLTITGSTISGNSTADADADGGGISAFVSSVSLDATTVANNASAALGGGISFADNEGKMLSIQNSIVAANTDSLGAPDFQAPPDAQHLSVRTSLIGDNAGTGLAEEQIPIVTGNLVGDASGDGIIDPKLAPLMSSGIARIHPLQPDSPALNTGNRRIVQPGTFDQRGAPFVRLFGSSVDMGAYELQTSDAALLRVTTTSDELDFTNSDVSLREAIVVANGRPGSDVIQFDPIAFANPAVIDLQLGQLLISDSLTVQGLGSQRFAIDAGGGSRIFSVSHGDVDLSISGLTLTGGTTRVAEQGGGAIQFRSNETLTLQDVVVAGNRTLGDHSHGGGIDSRFGTVVLQNSVIRDNATAGFAANGGGIQSGGRLLMTETTVADNATLGAGASGGGLFAHVDGGNALAMIRSTVSGNSTAGVNSHGGGVAIGSGGIELENSTVSHNTSSGNGAGIDLGGDVETGEHRVRFSTIAMNDSGQVGGGIHLRPENQLPLVIQNSIVATNLDVGSHPDLKLTGLAGATKVDGSLIGDNTGTNLAEAQTRDPNGNLIGDAGAGGVIDPLLGRLSLRGGLTASHSLLPGSPAIDAADPLFVGSLATDQRGAGFARALDRRPDIGAYEVQSIGQAVLIVDTVVDELEFSNSSTSLREALELAEGSAGHDTIRFDPNVFVTGATIDLIQGQLWIGDSVSIEGPGEDELTIDGLDSSRVFNIEATGVDVTLAGLTITGGRTSGDNDTTGSFVETTNNGGGIRFDGSGSLTLREVAVSGNQTTGSAALGGGIFARGAVVSIIDSDITDNQTAGSAARGGGLFVSHSDNISIRGTFLVGNTTLGDQAGGGAVASQQATVLIEGSQFAINETFGIGSPGGAIETLSGDLAIERTDFRQNQTVSADSPGGALFLDNGRLRTSDSSFDSNSTISSNSSGGAIAANQSMVLITRSALFESSVGGDGSHGGAVSLDASTAALINTSLSSNLALGSDSTGGAIFSGQGGAVAIVNGTITNNFASDRGGGVVISAGANDALSLSNTIVAGNSDSGIAPELVLPTNPANLTLRSSLIGDRTGTSLTEAQSPDVRGNLIGDSSGVGEINALLAPLAINGGSVPTHKPLSGSPVIDAGNNSLAIDIDSDPLTSDGRGAPFQRLVGTVDMGAFEEQAALAPIIEWSNPANLEVGSALTELQLNATTNTPGTFTYTPDIGTLLSLGDGQTLMVEFTPDDTLHHLTTSASVVINVVERVDRGDAPDTFSTLHTSDGPTHAVGALRLGALIDGELEGRPSDGADGDGGDDGVSPISSLITHPTESTTGTINVHASSSGMLDAWIDFNGNGVFDHPSEHLGGGTSLDLASRDNIVPVSIPAGAMPGQAFARFRFSSLGGLLPTGAAADGEVEDYVFTILDGSSPQTAQVELPIGPASLFADLGELVVERRGVELFRAAASVVDSFAIVGDEFSNVLTVDSTGGVAVPPGGLSFDGVDGVNSVRLVGMGQTLDLSRDGNISLRNIDVIDITDVSQSTLSLDARAVRAMDPTGSGVIVTGSSLDEVVFVDGPAWRMADPVNVAGFSFSFVTIADTFVQIDFGSPWQNRAQLADVSNDGSVTAIDALRVINELARRAFSDPDTSVLEDPANIVNWPNNYYDVSGEGMVTALDALRVINQLARQNIAGEGELVAQPSAIILDQIASPVVDDKIESAEELAPGSLSGEEQVSSPTFATVGEDAGRSRKLETDHEDERDAAVADVDQLLADPLFVDDLGP